MGWVRQASTIELGDDERAYLERLARRRKVARSDAQRAAIVLAAAERPGPGQGSSSTGSRLGAQLARAA